MKLELRQHYATPHEFGKHYKLYWLLVISTYYMHYPQTTQVPNALFDKHLPNISHAELKILLIIIRQTYGWIAPQTKQRKLRDRISHGQFITN